MAGVDIDAQIDRAAADGHKAVDQLVQFSGDEGEEIAGLGEGIVPDRIVTAISARALLDQIAVGQKAREGRGIGLHPHGVARQDVGPVWEIGDLAKALGLALAAKPPAGHIEPLQRNIGGRVDNNLGGQFELIGHILEGQGLVGQVIGFTRQDHAIDRDVDQLKPHAVQSKGSVRCTGPPNLQDRPHLGGTGFQLEVQNRAVDGKGEGLIVGKADGGRLISAHGSTRRA